MYETSCCHSVTIGVTNKNGLDERLGQGVSHTIEKAPMERRRGILVIQEAPGRFTVALSDNLPFGMTRELQSWRSR